MNEDNPRKKRLGWLKKSHPEPASDLAEERGRRAPNDPSSLLPSSYGFHGRLSGLLNKATQPFARNARQSLNPETAAANSGTQDIPRFPPSQITQDPSLLSAPTLEPNDKQSSNSGIAKAESPPDMNLVTETLAQAQTGVTSIGHAPTFVQNTSSAAGNLQSVFNVIDTFSTILGPLKVFNSIATGLADVHPYAKVALSMFTYASKNVWWKMILDQANRDNAVHDLLTKISDVYTFITEEEELAKMQSMLAVYVKIAQQTLECADFITHYSETKSACESNCFVS
ncbi:hypothetical protein DEU56DRAFT_759235 [Suillus clintonianus]|uniref:uncharacterized protein n=1 Tax=Suillus clintonianus TaxID=1904413 RepID=UPI001B85BD77|nr:uncharacterized protein DEU56DRAFT_759235 [Suillus clintonianus]KAG2125500.1 hypothetical protein DEU56DRAFT_759235 [Suillus clintonianus]